MQYITGEKLQELAEHSIVLNSNDNGGSELVKTQLSNTDCQYTYFERETLHYNISNEILKSKSLFVYTHILQWFFENIYPLLTGPFVLVTHNSDHKVGQEFKKYLDDSKIYRWLGQNIGFEHEKLIALPIGIGNSQWSHGDQNMLKSIKLKTSVEKNTLVYKNFSIAPYGDRAVINNTTHTNGIYMTYNDTLQQHWENIADSHFAICPAGNGIDTHRLWECLYLNCMPIVPNHIHYRRFKGLPIICAKDWNTITPKSLNRMLESMNYDNLFNDNPKLDLDYWRALINRLTKEI